MKIFVVVDVGNGTDLEKIVAEVDSENLHQAIAQVMRGGIHDRLNGIWYPPHQVRKIEYEPPTP
jgi:hypothetical protein